MAKDAALPARGRLKKYRIFRADAKKKLDFLCLHDTGGLLIGRRIRRRI